MQKTQSVALLDEFTPKITDRTHTDGDEIDDLVENINMKSAKHLETEDNQSINSS